MRLLTFLLVALVSAVGGDRVMASQGVILKVQHSPVAWSASKIGEKLRIQLTRNQSLRVLEPRDNGGDFPAFPHDPYNLDSLVNWGLEIGGRYLVLVDIHDERLEKRKSWHLPLLFHKYETIAVVEGELRHVDLSRGKLMLSTPFKVEQKGARVFQATTYDDVNDPDLHLPAPAKIRLFDHLEDKLCLHLVELISLRSRGR
ncbi:MAG: hypothetical protein KAU35_01735 [candidate division Zixibacteria bacterium]|nr:hypothetical protein [candidate division Zixibacteria bacterium]